MADASKIEWTDATWNPVGGCTRVSPGCQRCYAELRVCPRLHATGHPVYKDTVKKHANGEWRFTGKMTAAPDDHRVWTEPLKWRKPRRIFVCSTSDLFHESRPVEQIDRVFAIANLAKRHIFMLLTKRPKRMREYIESVHRPGMSAAGIEDAGRKVSPSSPYLDNKIVEWPLPNIWCMTSVEDQERADERIPEILATLAALRGLSVEPMLDFVDLRRWMHDWGCERCGYGGAQTADHCINCGWVGDAGPDEFSSCPNCKESLDDYHGCPECHATNDEGFGPTLSGDRLGYLNLIIAGGESGSRSRPTPEGAFEALRDQCAAAGVPFFMKQMQNKAPIPEHLQIRQWPQEQSHQ